MDTSDDFLASVEALLQKILTASSKLEEVKFEQDLDLRVDLIEMDLKLLEAEAETLTSRGHHLALMVQSRADQRADGATLKSINDVTSRLKSEWSEFKRNAGLATN